jgi:hypothetical protein
MRLVALCAGHAGNLHMLRMPADIPDRAVAFLALAEIRPDIPMRLVAQGTVKAHRRTRRDIYADRGIDNIG